MVEKNCKLYVGNLSYNMTEAELEGVFSEKGIAVQSVSIIKDKYTERSKGFGFVEVGSEEDVAKAVEQINGQQVLGRTIKVSQAREAEKRHSGPSNFSRRPGGNSRPRNDRF